MLIIGKVNHSTGIGARRVKAGRGRKLCKREINGNNER